MDDSINVMKFAESRATEILTLMEDVTVKQPKLTIQKLPYHMRRRAASHNPKRLPRSLRLKITQENSSKQKKRHKCHKSLLEEYNNRQKKYVWLPTHIWFAKRFHMKKMWGYQLPVQATGKRFRSSYRATIKHALLQDISYFSCIELRGNQQYLLSKLLLFTNDSLGMDFSSESYIDGTKEGSCFLYHPYSYPFSAIGPVSFLWSTSFSTQEVYDHQLWIWCHPTIHDELVDALVEVFELKIQSKNDIIPEYKFASKTNQMKTKLHFQKEPMYSSNSVTMTILKNTLVRHRLIGPKSLDILTSVLKITDTEEITSFEKGISDKDQGISPSSDESVKLKAWKYLTDTKLSYFVPLKTVIGLTVDDPRLYVTPNSSGYTCNGNTTMEECDLLDYFDNPSVSSSKIWDRNTRNKVTASQIPEHMINNEKSKYILPTATDLKKCTTNVPVIVIHQPGSNGYRSGWDIIAPQGWGMAFWIPFIYHGAQPAGFDDYCCLNLESGCPTFPCSAPDTKASARHEENVRESNLKKFYRYSRAKRPNFKLLGIAAPFFMPWKVLVSDWEKEFLKTFTEMSPSLPATGPVFPNLNSQSTIGHFFMLRNKKDIAVLKDLCSEIDKNKKQQSEDSLIHLQNCHKNLIQKLLNENLYLKSLILVRVKCLCRGTPTPFSGIYLPNENELKIVKSNSRYFGPIEKRHEDEYLDVPAKKRRKILKENAKIESRRLERPEIKSIISCTNFKIIGYMSEGGYSRLAGQGYGVGHCTLSGFLMVLDLSMRAKISAIVLIREQHNFQYRAACIEVIEHVY